MFLSLFSTNMPPKQKFTREEIIDAALNIVRREGVGGITARGLGTELGTSSRPIFTAFRDMEEVLKETMQAAKTLYNCHCARAFDTDLPLRSAMDFLVNLLAGALRICFCLPTEYLAFRLLLPFSSRTKR